MILLMIFTEVMEVGPLFIPHQKQLYVVRAWSWAASFLSDIILLDCCKIVRIGIEKWCLGIKLRTVLLHVSLVNKRLILLLFLSPGTNVDQAKKLLQESGLPIQSASDLSDAAEKAVACLN